MKILLTGLPGSGKTTQARILASDMGVPLISMGATLRSLAIGDSEDSKKIKEVVEKGEFVDDKIVAEIIKKRVTQKDCWRGYIMDGYPRSFSQFKFFDPEFDRVFYLVTPDNEAVKRLLNRQREDDTKDLIEKRLDIQKNALEDLLYYFKKIHILTEIDGSQSVEKVQEDIRKALV